jgi:hypothetical protein
MKRTLGLIYNKANFIGYWFFSTTFPTPEPSPFPVALGRRITGV